VNVVAVMFPTEFAPPRLLSAQLVALLGGEWAATAGVAVAALQRGERNHSQAR
jgi:hypothetical protein